MSPVALASGLVLLSIASCAYLPGMKSNRDMRYIDPRDSFPDNRTTISDAIQPLSVKCPICLTEGTYIQSMHVESAILRETNVLYSQYVCTNSHEWLIGQKQVDGRVMPARIMLSE